MFLDLGVSLDASWGEGQDLPPTVAIVWENPHLNQGRALWQVSGNLNRESHWPCIGSIVFAVVSLGLTCH